MAHKLSKHEKIMTSSLSPGYDNYVDTKDMSQTSFAFTGNCFATVLSEP